MSRFHDHATEDSGPQGTGLAQEPERQKWYRRYRDSDKDKKAKGEKADDIDYVEEVDGVWGKSVEGGPNYKSVGW